MPKQLKDKCLTAEHEKFEAATHWQPVKENHWCIPAVTQTTAAIQINTNTACNPQA